MTPNDRPSDMVTAVVAALTETNVALRAEVAAVAISDQRRSRRLSVYLGMIGLVLVAAVSGVVVNYQQGRDIKRLVSYLEGCQDPASACARRNAEQLGGAVKAVSLSVFDSVTCVLMTAPPDRTEATRLDCRARSFPK